MALSAASSLMAATALYGLFEDADVPNIAPSKSGTAAMRRTREGSGQALTVLRIDWLVPHAEFFSPAAGGLSLSWRTA